ncbi:MAG: tRNA pseudouridine(54/55) synthase Pus10 [Candidatus Thorarchaeota archaeon]
MIFDKVLEIYQKYYICIHCLGRMFSLLGTYTTNYERGISLLLSITMENHRNYLSQNSDIRETAITNLKIVANNANYYPAQKVLQNEGIQKEFDNLNINCYLCDNIFSNIDRYINRAKNLVVNLEFENFLVGSSPNSKIINREDKFKTKFNILEAESFKSHFNRVVGKELMASLQKGPEFNEPEILFLYYIEFENFKIELIIKSLFIFGRYNKFIRGIPQTHWFCKKCLGNGCELCNYTGKQYMISVEDLISTEFIKRSKATDLKFHGAGREDIDVRMLGSGRPFILELRNPKVRNIDLKEIQKKVNKSNKKKVKIHDLEFSNKKEVVKIKSNAKDIKKIYRAIVKAQSKVNKDVFYQKLLELKHIFENKEIHQRTPYRVSHRRADKIREKLIYRIEGKIKKSNIFEFEIETQGGTYIKELISGDKGRTSPSFSEIFEIPLDCQELDVIEISI